MSWDDSGTGIYDGQYVYWHRRDDETTVDIFPGGVPSSSDGHDHIILQNAKVRMFRDDYFVTEGQIIFKRINGIVEIDLR